MMPTDPVREMLQRLTAVDWHDEYAFEKRKSRTALMREYLRRSAWWAQAVNATDEWPFFDIAAHINPAVRANPELVGELEAFIANNIGFPSVAKTCVAALHWAALLATPGVRLPDLPDPFAPLLMMYERGGGFTTEHGFIEVGLQSIVRKSWQDHLTPDQIVSLDPAELDALDRADSLK